MSYRPHPTPVASLFTAFECVLGAGFVKALMVLTNKGGNAGQGNHCHVVHVGVGMDEAPTPISPLHASSDIKQCQPIGMARGEV